jgi:hypothetical protein
LGCRSAFGDGDARLKFGTVDGALGVDRSWVFDSVLGIRVEIAGLEKAAFEKVASEGSCEGVISSDERAGRELRVNIHCRNLLEVQGGWEGHHILTINTVNWSIN